MADEIDSIGAEAAAISKTMLQLATLVALRTRERGQKEAEQRVKVNQVRMKEAKELAARQVREAKARDPRNQELQQMIQQTGIQLAKDRQTIGRNREELHRDRADVARVTDLPGAPGKGKDTPGPTSVPAGANVLGYDSAERRMALALHLGAMGVEPELVEARMLADVAMAHPPIAAARTPVLGPTPMQQGKYLDPRARQRTLERRDR